MPACCWNSSQWNHIFFSEFTQAKSYKEHDRRHGSDSVVFACVAKCDVSQFPESFVSVVVSSLNTHQSDRSEAIKATG